MRLGDALLFGTLASAVHLGAFLLVAESDIAGRQGGAFGVDQVSLQAAPDALTALVTQWDQAPTARSEPPPRVAANLEQGVGTIRIRPVESHQAPPVAPALLASPFFDQGIEILRREPLHQDQVTALTPLPDMQNSPSRSLPVRPLEAHNTERDHAVKRSAAPARIAPLQAPPKPEVTIDQPRAPSEQVHQITKIPPRTRPNSARREPSAPSVGAQAAGAAGSARAASSRTATLSEGTAAGSGNARQLEAAWGARIQAKVQRSARRAQVSKAANVRLIVTVAPSGTLIDVNIARSSGLAKADRAAVDAVRRARRFAPAPEELRAASYRFQITLRFKE